MARVREQLFSADAFTHRIGRYRVVEPIGLGGMGMVYSAHDDKLDRRVAVKILRQDELPTEEARLRFLREAQALARLSHPNVVAVHEAGDHEGEMYLAMEFVQGQDLNEWLGENHEASNVLEVLLQAGRGLLAAHDAGLVHRDFKPANVMRSEDGLVKVLDFGLACPLETTLCDSSVGSLDLSPSSALTMAGDVVGTPAYMSPEQHRGDELDARSDQYSFCVTVWEGLVGQRPFDQRDYHSLARAKHRGPPHWPDSAASQPRHVVQALRRGLATDPEDRWPSMQPLLEVLDSEPRRRRWLLNSVGIGLVALGSGALALQSSSDTDQGPCTATADQLTGIWDASRRAEVESVILGIDKAYAADIWVRAERALDDYATDWAAMYTDACTAVMAGGTPRTQVLDLTTLRCLQRASNQLRATVDVLANADPDVVQNAHALTSDLPALSRCTDAKALLADVEPPPEAEAAVVNEVRRHLAHSQSLRRAGRYSDALAAVEMAGQRLAGVEYGPVRAEYAFQRGVALHRTGDDDGAEEVLEQAMELAARYGQRHIMASVATLMITVVGHDKQLIDEGLRYRSIAMGLAEGKPLEVARVRHAVAAIFRERGDYADAEAEFRAAIALVQHAQGDKTSFVANARLQLGSTLLAMGRKRDAEVEQRAGLAALTATLGPDHPRLGEAYALLGRTLAELNKLDEAKAAYRRALSISESALASDNPTTVRMHVNFAAVLRMSGDLQQAEAEYRAALPLYEQSLGTGHPNVAMARINFANMLRQLQQFEEAESQLRSSLDVIVRTFRPDHLNVIITHINLADSLIQLHRNEEAEAQLHLAITALERSHSPDHHVLGMARVVLTGLLVLEERFEEARPLAEAAWARQQREDVLPEDKATAAFLLARTLWNVKRPYRDRPRARTLAELAVDTLETHGDTKSDLVAFRRWFESLPAQ